jgi:hypothetical protein
MPNQRIILGLCPPQLHVFGLDAVLTLCQHNLLRALLKNNKRWAGCWGLLYSKAKHTEPSSYLTLSSPEAPSDEQFEEGGVDREPHKDALLSFQAPVRDPC